MAHSGAPHMHSIAVICFEGVPALDIPFDNIRRGLLCFLDTMRMFEFALVGACLTTSKKLSYDRRE
jgi:hypothetical protein